MTIMNKRVKLYATTANLKHLMQYP